MIIKCPKCGVKWGHDAQTCSGCGIEAVEAKARVNETRKASKMAAADIAASGRVTEALKTPESLRQLPTG